MSRPDDIEGAPGAPLGDIPPPENYFTPSVPALHEYGVLYQGEFETPSDGTAIAVRRHAVALAATGIPLLLRSFSNVVVSPDGIAEPVPLVGLPEEVDAEVGHLLRPEIAHLRPVIKHVVIRSAEHCRQLLNPRGAVPLVNTLQAQMAMRDALYANTIVFSVWERDRIDAGIARHLARVRQCWVPCTHNARLLRDAGVPEQQVHVVPHPYVPNDPVHACTRRPPDYFKDWRFFYSIGRWEPRKGFDELVRAFLRAFKPGDPVGLCIKYSGSGQWQGYPTPEETVRRAIAQSPHGWDLASVQRHVELRGGRLKRGLIVKLHHENNIYVSASHGEGFALPLFDAKLAGNRVVYVPYGGPVDLVEDMDVPVAMSLGPVDPSYAWEHGARWATYDLEALTEALQRAQPPAAFQRPPHYEARFSMGAVGQQMRALVDATMGAS